MFRTTSNTPLTGHCPASIRKYLSCSSLLILLTLPGLAQRMAVPGYIVRSDNTVVRGLVGVKSPVTYSTHVLFKVSEQGAFERYTPEQIKEFGFDSGEKFQSLPAKDERRFLKVIVDGKLDLLQLEEPGSVSFYSRLEDKLPSLLVYKVTLIDNRYRHENEYYKQQLKSQMGDLPAIQAEIDEVKKYEQKALTDLFTKYNQAIDPGAIVLRKLPTDTIHSIPANSTPAKTTFPAAWFFGVLAGKALSDPGFVTIGISVERESRSKVLFTSFILQTGGIRKKHDVTGHGTFSSSHSMTQLGTKVNFVIVPLKTVQPYASMVVNYLRYKNSITIDRSETIRASAIAMGVGLGIKFRMSTAVSFKTELEIHLIPGPDGLADDTSIYLFNPQYTVANKPLRILNLGLLCRLR